MSILIKGILMPNNCCDCEVLMHCQYSIYGYWDKRAEDCPLVEIPTPHGRLIEEHYSGELQAKQPEGVFILYRPADKDADRFMLEAEE